MTAAVSRKFAPLILQSSVINLVLRKRSGTEKKMESLTGQFLISMPQMDDPYFARSLVYLCAHSPETGAMGLIVNKTMEAFTLGELYTQLKIEPVALSNRPRPVHFGGPVAP